MASARAAGGRSLGSGALAYAGQAGAVASGVVRAESDSDDDDAEDDDDEGEEEQDKDEDEGSDDG